MWKELVVLVQFLVDSYSLNSSHYSVCQFQQKPGTEWAQRFNYPLSADHPPRGQDWHTLAQGPAEKLRAASAKVVAVLWQQGIF